MGSVVGLGTLVVALGTSVDAQVPPPFTPVPASVVIGCGKDQVRLARLPGDPSLDVLMTRALYLGDSKQDERIARGNLACVGRSYLDTQSHLPGRRDRQSANLEDYRAASTAFALAMNMAIEEHTRSRAEAMLAQATSALNHAKALMRDQWDCGEITDDQQILAMRVKQIRLSGAVPTPPVCDGLPAP